MIQNMSIGEWYIQMERAVGCGDKTEKYLTWHLSNQLYIQENQFNWQSVRCRFCIVAFRPHSVGCGFGPLGLPHPPSNLFLLLSTTVDKWTDLVFFLRHVFLDFWSQKNSCCYRILLYYAQSSFYKLTIFLQRVSRMPCNLSRSLLHKPKNLPLKLSQKFVFYINTGSYSLSRTRRMATVEIVFWV